MSLLEVVSGNDGTDETLSAEHARVQGEAEDLLAPLLPMFDFWRRDLEGRGGEFRIRLLVGQYPTKGPGNPVKAALLLSIGGPGFWSGGHLFDIEAYMPDDVAWFAAELENRIEEHLLDPEFGCLHESIRDMAFRHVQYDRPRDHEHCACCSAGIAISPDDPEEADAYVSTADSSYEIYLCPRCFKYWAPRRNLISS